MSLSTTNTVKMRDKLAAAINLAPTFAWPHRDINSILDDVGMTNSERPLFRDRALILCKYQSSLVWEETATPAMVVDLLERIRRGEGQPAQKGMSIKRPDFHAVGAVLS